MNLFHKNLSSLTNPILIEQLSKLNTNKFKQIDNGGGVNRA